VRVCFPGSLFGLRCVSSGGCSSIRLLGRPNGSIRTTQGPTFRLTHAPSTTPHEALNSHTRPPGQPIRALNACHSQLPLPRHPPTSPDPLDEGPLGAGEVRGGRSGGRVRQCVSVRPNWPPAAGQEASLGTSGVPEGRARAPDAAGSGCGPASVPEPPPRPSPGRLTAIVHPGRDEMDLLMLQREWGSQPDVRQPSATPPFPASDRTSGPVQPTRKS